ncbi:phosphotransferase [bacterium]|nr:phosphotransferase [bacterium]
MKEQERIPVSKVQRASKFVGTGAKVGVNYLKNKIKGGSREELDKANAEDIFNTLSELKGSALKMAQIISMDQNMLPQAYIQKFALAQYAAPPLSLPLVVKTFKETLGKSPFEIFDDFSKNAVNAASMGQVHKASYKGKTVAVKIQYPGVADSVESDLNLVKPFATRLVGFKGADVDQYFNEVKERLLEETDYELELSRSMAMAAQVRHLNGLQFPHFYPELSSKRIITMDWLDGMHLGEFLKTNPSAEVRNKVGQHLWDFYNYQINHMYCVHADPHPGNFLFHQNGEVGVLDFGCVKEFGKDFYHSFFSLLSEETLNNEEKLLQRFTELKLVYPDDSEQERQFFLENIKHSISLVARPFRYNEFDFGDKAFIREIYEFGEKMGKSPEIRKTKKARGPKDALFINRTLFGIYNMLHELKATVKVNWDFEKA